MKTILLICLSLTYLLPFNATADSGVEGIDHVGLTVTDLNASVEFFTTVLGYTLTGRDEDYPAAFLSNADSFITLWRASEPSKAKAFDRKNNVGLHHMALTVSSFTALDALYEKVKTVPGVIVEFSPELAYGGPARHMMIREPSGNRLEFVHRPATGE